MKLYSVNRCLALIVLNTLFLISCSSSNICENINLDEIGSFQEVEGKSTFFRSNAHFSSEVSIESNGKSYDVEWKTMMSSNGQITLSIPRDWKLQLLDSVKILEARMPSDSLGFFLFSIAKKEGNISMQDYLGEVENDLRSANFSVEIEPSIHGKVSDFFVTAHDPERINGYYYVMVGENSEFIFDFTFHSLDEAKFEYYEIVFYSILQSISVGSCTIF